MMRENGIQQGSQRYFNNWHGLGSSGRFTDTIGLPFVKSPSRSYAIFAFIFVLLVGALVSTRLLDSNAISGSSNQRLSSTKTNSNAAEIKRVPRNEVKFPLNCTALNLLKTCPVYYPTSISQDDDASTSTCPEYFRWIYEDLRPWARTGITRDMVERAKKTANFRLVIVKGRAYVETFVKAFQTRDIFTLWGIVQLLRKYPGKIPDLELMFDCVDWPVIKKTEYTAVDAPVPPPLFRYCSNDESLDIVFPDWSFWGWPEINVKPWGLLLKDLEEGNRRSKWTDREPYAFWKGNPKVAKTREDLLTCNVSEKQDWNARLFSQDWSKESKEGYKQSDLGSQCIDRFKIYIEGSAWSVSEKYILACDSVTLIVKPHYYDFFSRGLIPLHHYWPIKEDDKCRSIKFAVDWGNTHQQKAQSIGRAASKFVQEELKLDYVYDYMFHLLNQYSKLLRFKPTIPPKAVEICAESMSCNARGLKKKFMLESMVTSPAETSPCTLSPPYDPSSLHAVLWGKENTIGQVELWEKTYWQNQTKLQS